MDIETAATSELKSRIASTELLSQFINERDKEPVWDGPIYAYSDKKKKNENMIGRAHVQVKGKQVKKLSAYGRTYPVSRSNMISYRNDGGVMYFVVELTNDGKKKIFYASLTPYLLNRYLNVFNTGNIKINLKQLPDNNNDFENLVINFINDSKRQAILNTGKNWTIPEIVKLLGPNNVKMNCHFTARGYDTSDPFTLMMQNEIYLYMQNDDGSMNFPVQYLENIESMCAEMPSSVSANGKMYYDKIVIEKFKDGHRSINIGKSIKILENDGKVTLKYNMSGTLDEQIQTLEFLEDMITDKGFYLNDGKLTFNPTKEELKQFVDGGMEGKLRKFREIKKLLDLLGVKESFEIDNATDKQLRDLEVFMKALLYDEKIHFNEADLPPLGMFDISNLHLMLLLRQQDDGAFEIKDYFRTKIRCELDEAGHFDTSQFCIMRDDNYLKASNMDLRLVEESFKEHHNTAHYERMNLCLLEMIKAYDQDGTRADLLELAESLFQWLIENDERNSIYVLNKLQCIARKRDFSNEELTELSKLSQDSNSQIQLGANILLGNNKVANMQYNALSDEDQEMFSKYPIFQFYQHPSKEDRKVAP